MKVKVDSILRADVLEEATKKKPVKGTIKSYRPVPVSELPFESRDPADKHELTVELKGDVWTWLANKTSLKSIIAEYGDDSDAWVGKELSFYVVQQNVSGQMKDVVYAEA